MKQDLLLPQILSLSSEQTGILLFNMAVNGMAANGHPSVPLPAATKLRRIVEDPNAFLMCPGVYDGYSARIALQVGFDGLYMVRQLIKLAVLQHACRNSGAARYSTQCFCISSRSTHNRSAPRKRHPSISMMLSLVSPHSPHSSPLRASLVSHLINIILPDRRRHLRVCPWACRSWPSLSPTDARTG